MHSAMKYYLCIILVVGVSGQGDQNENSAVNTEKMVDEKVADVTSDQNTAGGNINTNNYYGNGIIGLNHYYGGVYGKYFGKDIEEFLYDVRDNKNYERTRGNHRHFGYDDGNPDIHGRIQRPCQAYDTFCIRKFFAEHSQCKISGRQVPDPLFRAQSNINIPNTNISAMLVNVEYKGIKDGRVEEFYIDKVTDNLVLTVDFDAVSFATANAYLKYYLRGREPIVTRDAAAASYLKLTTTVVIPNLKDLRLERAEVFTSTSEPIPPFIVGPRLGLSTDPEVPLMYAEYLAKFSLATVESLLTEGNFYVTNFIQYNICDFGLKVL